MDEHEQRYELDMNAVMMQLASALSERGYEISQRGDGQVWHFRTAWGRGAAYGEIGSTLYSLVAANLHEVDDEHH